MSNDLVPQEDLPDSHFSGQEVPTEDLHSSGDEVPSHDLPMESEGQYSTPGQETLTAGENFAKGALPFIAQKAENALSDMGVTVFSPQEQWARQQANPALAKYSKIAGNIGMMLTAPEIKGLSVAGGMALNNALQMGIISGGDEYSKALMGHGDPTGVVAAHVIGSTVLGGAGGLLFGKGSEWLNNTEGMQAGSRLQAALAGFGHELKFPSGVNAEGMQSFSKEAGTIPSEDEALQAMKALPDIEGEASVSGGAALTSPKLLQSFQSGQKMAKGLPGKIVRGLSDVGGGYLGGKIGHEGAGALITDHLVKAAGIEPMVNKAFTRVGQKYFGPAILKMAQSGRVSNLAQALDYAGSVGSGAQCINQGLDYLFNTGSNELANIATSPEEREALKDFQNQGGVSSQMQQDANQQQPIMMPGYAEGGEVQAINPLNQPTNEIASHWPTQNIMINATRGRISKYLDSMKPTPQNQLLLDSNRPDPQKEKDYDRAIDLINKPLGVLKHIKQGTLLPPHVSAIKSVYPDLHAHLSSKITERLMQNKLDEEKKPPYKVRQALSLFLGGNVDSTMTQPNIMAAQNTFVIQKAQQAQQNAPPNSKAELSKIGQNAQTVDQSRQQRMTKS